MGEQKVNESKYNLDDEEEINANKIFMQDLKRSYPEFAKALEEFMKTELERIDEEN